MIKLNHTNLCDSLPSVGDVLVIETKKTKPRKILCKVKSVVNGNEIILQKSTNSYFIWDVYMSGGSWVWRVWNLGGIEATTSVNNTNQLLEL